MEKIRLLAIYLPQYYPTKENNEWWGKGFTEWNNVVKAKPLFKGHYQPHIPSTLGFYDLRLSETRVQQAELAEKYGIEGFCYWHYWFGHDKRLLDRPFKEVLESKKPDFPFCLAWANHSWYAKTWQHDKPNKLLIKQNYFGVDDYIKHFYDMLPAFKDKRYIKVENKLFFMIFSPLDSPEIPIFINTWRELAKKNDLNDFYFVGQGLREQKSKILSLDFNAFQDNSLFSIFKNESIFVKTLRRIQIKVFHKPAKIYDYSKVLNKYPTNDFKRLDVIPSIIPNWDHSPRSKEQALILKNSTPKKFGNHIKQIFSLVKKKPYENRIVMIKSWNEWGEGNYLEPDERFGEEYLEQLRINNGK